MDEEVSIINTKTRNEKIKDFLIQNKKGIIVFFSSIILIVIIFLGFNDYKDKKRIEISNTYNSSIIDYKPSTKEITVSQLIQIIEEKDSTYSPLALFFIIDNELISDISKINLLFDIIIEKTSLEEEIKYLIIYKKALFNADSSSEENLLNILRPLINSNSVWEAHALYLLAEFFFSKNEKLKSKEFFNQLINLENANQDLKREARKRLNRDLSD